MTDSPPNRRRATIIGLVNHYGAIITMAVQGFVLVPLYLRFIDAKTYGAWLATGNVVAWLAVLDPGLSAVFMQRIGQAYGRNDRDALSRVIGTGLAINLTFCGLFVCMGIAVAPFVPGLIHLDADIAGLISRVFAAAAAAEGTLLAGLSVLAVMLAMLERPATLGVANVGTAALGIVVTVFLIHRGFGVMSIPLGLLARAATLLILMLVLFTRVVWTNHGVRPRWSTTEFREVTSLVGYTWVARLGSSLVSNVDSFFVARILGASRVPTLVLTRRGTDVVGDANARVAVAFSPALTHLHGEGHIERFREMVLRVVRIVGAVAAIGLGGFVALNRDFMHLWVGSAFYGGLGLTAILGVAAAVRSFNMAMHHSLFASGHVKETSRATMIESINRVALVALGLKLGFGLIGVGLAAVASTLLTTVILGRYFVVMVALGVADGVKFFASISLRLALLIALGFFWNRFAPRADTWPLFALAGAIFSLLGGAVLLASSPSLRGELRPLIDRITRRLPSRS